MHSIAVVFVSSIAGKAFYYNGKVNERNSRIASLNAQIANLNNEIANLTSQVSNRTEQIANLTSTNPKVRITNFSLIDGWASLGQAECVRPFNLTVENYGLTDVNRLVLRVTMFDKALILK